MLFGTPPDQVILISILAAAILLLFTEWIRLHCSAILKVPVWHILVISPVHFDPARGAILVFCQE